MRPINSARSREWLTVDASTVSILMTEKHRIAKSRVGTNYTTLPSNDKTNIYTAATRERYRRRGQD